MEKVHKVIRINTTINKEDEDELAIFVIGSFNSSGYTNPQLFLRQYDLFPEDGIFDFDFMADKPAIEGKKEAVAILADFVWNPFPKKIKGVRIHGENETMLHYILLPITMTSEKLTII